jgi:hypothetical protein
MLKLIQTRLLACDYAARCSRVGCRQYRATTIIRHVDSQGAARCASSNKELRRGRKAGACGRGLLKRSTLHPPLPSLSLTMTATGAPRVATAPVRLRRAFGRARFAAQAARDLTRPSGHSFEVCARPAAPPW